jgi:LacI family transcriptional regulator
MDSFAMAMQVYRKVWERGFRRIGIATLRHELELFDDDARIGGLLAMHYRLASESPPVPPLLAEIAKASQAVPEWFQRYRPEIVIGFPSTVFFSLLESGVKIPEEAGYCGIIHNSVPGYGSLAGFAGRGEDFGALAMEWLDELIRHQQRGIPADPRDLLFQGKWTEGSSLPLRRS